jgi:hemerythrin-like domain-containing protein
VSDVPEPIAGLIRDHRTIEAVVTAVSASVSAAAASAADGSLLDQAFADLLRLRDLLARQVAVHIAKEEQVLFPVLRAELAELSDFVEDMIAEHDQVREQKALIAQTLAALDAQHNVIDGLREGVVVALQEAGADPAAVVAGLRETVLRLDWVLQGHFTGEEDGLFLPAEESLSAATLAEMAARMAAIEVAAG